jgi:hypothetical protein
MSANTPEYIQQLIRERRFDGWEKWAPEAQLLLRDELKRAVETLNLKVPETDDELKLLVRETCGVIIPDTQVCVDHTTPFRAFADAFFARSAVSIWLASRGFGGKSFLLALLGHVEAFTLGAEVAILGGSGEQSLGVMRYLQKFTGGEQTMTQRQSLYGSGGKIRAQMASSTSVRGPHPQRLRLDEVDEMELEILDAAMGQPIGTAKIAKQTVMSSTHHYPDRTFSEVLRRAEENAFPVYRWCYRESSAHPDGWLSVDEILSKQKEVTAAMFSAEYDLQEPSPEDRAILPEKIDACFDKSLGEFKGQLGERIEIEAPVSGATYATGCDWAKKKDFTIIDTFRIDCKPFRRVAWQRTGRLPWPMMIARFEAQVKRYPGRSAHDATGLGDVVEDYQGAGAEPVVLVGVTRSDVFTKYIAAIENGAIISPKIRHCENEHRYCTNDDLRGGGHPPDSFIAGAMAYRAATKPEPVADETYSVSYVTY